MKRFLFLCLLLLQVLSVKAAPVYVEHDWLANNMTNENIIVLDMTADNVQYLRFHIPGSIRLSYQDIVTKRKRDKVSVRLADAQLVKLLGGLGVSNKHHVVIYDDMGGLDAGRLFWELERIGHPEVSVLRGGLVQWVLAGHKVDNKPEKRLPVTYKANGGGRDNEAVLADIKESNATTLLDVRSIEEYVGHPRYPRTGRIPGARWWPWENNVDFENGFVPKSAQSLQKALDTIGVKEKDMPLTLYCRSGHRASQSYLTLRDLGYTNVKLYDASMAEYSQQRELPLEKGR